MCDTDAKRQFLDLRPKGWSLARLAGHLNLAPLAPVDGNRQEHGAGGMVAKTALSLPHFCLTGPSLGKKIHFPVIFSHLQSSLLILRHLPWPGPPDACIKVRLPEPRQNPLDTPVLAWPRNSRQGCRLTRRLEAHLHPAAPMPGPKPEEATQASEMTNYEILI
jgi:hypothetical protein